MTNSPPIAPPPELVDAWLNQPDYTIRGVIGKAARWGADQELEACCELLPGLTSYLRKERRPKPSSLKEQAFDALDAYVYGNPDHGDKQNTYNIIRQALEQLPND